MQRHRVLVAFGIAWLSAVLLSWWVYKESTAPQSRDLVYAVAATQDLPAGKRLQPADLKLITLDRKDLPKGSFLKISDVVDRAVTVPVASGPGPAAFFPSHQRRKTSQSHSPSGDWCALSQFRPSATA